VPLENEIRKITLLIAAARLAWLYDSTRTPLRPILGFIGTILKTWRPLTMFHYIFRLLLYILPVIAISVLLNIPKFFETLIIETPVEAETQ
jgi:hypothetical protein